MSEGELEAMVVELGGDSTDFTKMMEQAALQIDTLGKKVQESGKAIEAIKGPMQTMASTAQETFGKLNSLASGVIKTLMGMQAINWIKGGMNSAIEGEKLMVQLKSSIHGTTEEVDAAIIKYTKFAETMASLTIHSKGEILSNIKQAEAMGLTGDKAMWATKALIGMNDALGEGKVSMRMMAMLAEGIVPPRLAMYFPELKKITDESQKLARAQELISEKFKVSQALLDTAGGQIEKLEQDWKGLRKEFGTILMEGLKPMVQLQREVVKWFKGMSKEAKTAVVVAVGLGIAFITLSSAIAIAGTVFNTYFGGIGILIGAIVTIVTALVFSFGGVGKTMEGLKQGLEALWEWLKPIRVEISHLWDTIKEFGAQVWENLKAATVAAWKYIFGQTTINWNQIRDYIVDTLIVVEFIIKHLGDTWELIWTGMKYYAVLALNTVLKNIYMVFAGPMLAAIFTGFLLNWSGLWDSMVDYAMKGLRFLLQQWADLPSNMAKLLSGAISIRDILKDWAGEMTFSWTGVTIEGLDKLEKQLEAEFNQQKDKFKGSLEEFKKQRKADLGITPEQEKAALEGGMDLGKQMNKGVVSQIKMLDAVLAGSLAAMDRYIEYRNKLEGKATAHTEAKVVGGGIGGGTIGPAGAGAVTNAGAGTPGELGGQAIPLLTQIRDILAAIANKPSVTVSPAGLT